MASNPSQKIITFEALKKDLEIAVKTAFEEVEEHLNARDAPLTFTQDSLYQRIRQHMRYDEYIVQLKSVNILAGLGPYFYNLPRELRNEIFIDLLTSGHPNFMRTSRAIEQEGKAWISKAGIYRINVGFSDRTNCQKPNQNTVDRIQNVNLKIQHPLCPVDAQILDFVIGPSPHHKTCNVFFERAISYFAIGRLQRFTWFEKVALRVSTGFRSSYIDPDVRTWALGRMRGLLEPILGKADVAEDETSCSMVFYPRKAEEATPVFSIDGSSGTPA